MKNQHNTERAFGKESELVSSLVQALQAQRYRVRIEVSNMGQSIDVVATRGRWVTVIEAKLQDWRRALNQCRAHEQVADFICIAIGSAEVSDSLTAEATRAGYGIIHFCRDSQEFRWVRRPSRNRRVWLPQRRHWAQGYKRINYAN
jgi:hypothetical protein